MGNPYFFPPHHEDDMYISQRTTPAPVPCDLPVPYVHRSVTQGQRNLKQVRDRAMVYTEECQTVAQRATGYDVMLPEGMLCEAESRVLSASLPLLFAQEDPHNESSNIV
eukprot:854577-Pyramimonas_sp.AAC.1